jgi:putative molybdopterin biosynthesis protein
MAQGVDEPSRVKAQRERLGMTQSTLAQLSGISRQSLSAIEAGRAEPSVGTAVRIAKALSCAVEDLFGDPRVSEQVEVELAAPLRRFEADEQRVALAFIRERWVAHPLHGGPSVAQAASALAPAKAPSAAEGALSVELLQPLAQARETVILMGCAPALGLLAQRLNEQPGPGRFLWLERSSSDALTALRQGHAHVAGVHFHTRGERDANAAAIRQRFADGEARAFTLARWQAGLVVGKGNPLHLAGAQNLVRPRLRIAARERGTGARMLLEQLLENAKVKAKPVLERALVVRGQLDVGRAIALGAADVGLAMEHAALAYNLAFVPLAEERFDLVVARASQNDPRVKRMLDVMNGQAFRRELASLGGYVVDECGSAVSLAASLAPSPGAASSRGPRAR